MILQKNNTHINKLERKKEMEKKLVIIVINKIELFDKLVITMNDAGFGGTAINSSGLAQELAKKEDSHIIAALRAFMVAGRTENKTIFTVVPESKIPELRDILVSIIGDLSEPNSGIIFSVPVDFSEGLI